MGEHSGGRCRVDGDWMRCWSILVVLSLVLACVPTSDGSISCFQGDSYLFDLEAGWLSTPVEQSNCSSGVCVLTATVHANGGMNITSGCYNATHPQNGVNCSTCSENAETSSKSCMCCTESLCNANAIGVLDFLLEVQSETLCQGHGTWNSNNASCSCHQNFEGDDCSSCVESMHGPECDIYCHPLANCSGQGTCWTDGTCICSAGFPLPSCICDNTTTCFGNGVCNETTNECVCSEGFTGGNCAECVENMFGPSCNRHCTANETCYGRGICIADGTCACEDRFTGAFCGICADGFGGPNCDVTCSADGTCNGNGVCNSQGACVCSAGFTGAHCNVCAHGHGGLGCAAWDDDVGNGMCSQDGSCICAKGWSGSACDQCDSNRYGDNCQFQCDCGDHGICTSHGICECAPELCGASCDVCAAGYVGLGCSVRAAQIACEHGITTGTRECLCIDGFTGSLCAECIPGMFGEACDEELVCQNGIFDGRGCLCAEGWTGSACDQCESGRYGESCDLECECGDHGTCDGGGICECVAGFVGPRCEDCAPGYVGLGCSVRAEEIVCEHGLVTGNGMCSCTDGFTGASCSECEDGRSGVMCERECNADDDCSGHGFCLRDGGCECIEGYVGAKCEACAPGMFGEACDEEFLDESLCQNGIFDGRGCLCAEGWTGSACDQCESGRYGESCDLECECGDHGTCDGGGICECVAGFVGPRCEDCAPGYVGLGCSVRAEEIVCEHGLVTGNGMCSCTDGFTGASCSECEDGRSGVMCERECNADDDCSGHGFCLRDGGCECIEGYVGAKCEACAPGMFGEACDEEFLDESLCQNGIFDGRGCLCAEGWTGSACDQCKSGRYGESCDLECECGDHGFCSQGGCECMEGFTGPSCRQYVGGYFGEGCVVLESDCVHGLVDGKTCVCSDGYAGASCEECAANKWGEQCQNECTCQMGACMADGSCECISGWTGADCDQCCDDGFYGPDCSIRCDPLVDCSGNGLCTGNATCVCVFGFGGDSCNNCIDNYYGDQCDILCLAEETCQGQGTCNARGECDCFQFYEGPNCGVVEGLHADPPLLDVSETPTGIEIIWNRPLYVGNTDSDVFNTSTNATANLTYEVEVTPCNTWALETVAVNNSCRNSSHRYTVHGTQNRFSIFLTEDMLKMQAIGYWVSGRTDNGRGFGDRTTVRVLYRILPSLMSPLSSQKTYAAVRPSKSERAVSVWQNDEVIGPALRVAVKDFLQHPADFDVFRGTVYIPDRSGTAYEGEITNVHIEGDLTQFDFVPPGNVEAACGSSCRAVVVFKQTTSLAKLQIILRYYSYKAPRVESVYPSDGSQSGGSLVQILLTQPVGPRTRFAVGLPNVVEGDLRLGFSCFEGGEQEVSADITVTQLDTEGDSAALVEVLVVSPSRPCEGSGSWMQISSSGTLLDFVQGTLLQFAFLGPRISYFVPASALLVPGAEQDVELFVEDFGDIANHSAIVVSMGGIRSSILAVSKIGRRVHHVIIRAPTFPTDQVGTNLAVIFSYADRNVRSSFLYETPPDAVVIADSIRVNGKRQLWLVHGKANTVNLEISHLTPAFGRIIDSLNVSVGGTLQQVTFKTVGDKVRVSAMVTPPSIGYLPIVITSLLNGNVVATITDTDQTIDFLLESRDVNVPRIVSAAPGGVHMRGGSFVLLGIETAAPTLTRPTSVMITVDFSNGVTKEIEFVHMLPLASWRNKDAAYQSAVGDSGFDSCLTEVSQERLSAYASVASELYKAALASEDVVQAMQTSSILLFRFPLAGNASSAKLTLKDADHTIGSVDMQVFSDFFGLARVNSIDLGGSASPTSALEGGAVLTVEVVDFSVLEKVSELVCAFDDGKEIAVYKLLSSTAAGTIFSILVPPASIPGDVQVMCHPSFHENNVATFSFTYFDANGPKVVHVQPSAIYADGGATIEVELDNFLSSALTSSIDVLVISGSASTPVPLQSLDKGPTTVLTFVAPAGAVGTAVILLTSKHSTASFELKYLEAKLAVPVLDSLKPSSGPVSGSTATDEIIITAIISGMRMAASKDEVVLVFNGEAIDLVSDPAATLLSTDQRTMISFSLPAASAAGVVDVSVRHSKDLFFISTTTFSYYAVKAPVLKHVRPTRVVAGELTTIFVGIDVYETFDAVSSSIQDPSVMDIQGASFQLSAASDTVTFTLTIQALSVGATSITLSTCQGGTCTVAGTFALSVSPANTLRILDFDPQSGFLFGETFLRVQVANLGDIVPSAVFLTSNVFNVSGNSVEEITGNSTVSMSRLVTFTVPAQTEEQELGALVWIPSRGFTEPLAFTLTSAGPSAIANIVPSRAPSASSTAVVIHVNAFPGVRSTAQLRLKFETVYTDESGETAVSSVSAGVTSLLKRGSLRQPWAAQDVTISLVTPTLSNIIPGATRLRVEHVEYPHRSVTTPFTLYDERAPQIMAVSSQTGRGNLVRMSTKTIVTVYVSGAPPFSNDHKLRLQNSNNIAVRTETDSTEGTATFVFPAPPSDTEGVTHGLLSYGASSASTCTPSCCEEEQCADACPGIQTNCFTLEYYDDLRPEIEYVSATEGPSVGGTSIEVEVTRFAFGSTESDLLVLFGDTGVTGTVVVNFASAASSAFTIVTPRFELGDAKRKHVTVSLVSLVTDGLSISFQFLFENAEISLIAVYPMQGNIQGGVKVTVLLDSFPPADEPHITFGATSIAYDDIIMLPSTGGTSLSFSFITPATSKGSFSVQIVPRSCFSGCGAVYFDFVQFAAERVELVEPVPSSQPEGSSRSKMKVRLSGIPEGITESDIMATVSSSSAVQVYQAEPTKITGKKKGKYMELTFDNLPSLASGLYTVVIVVASLEPVSFEYRVFAAGQQRLIGMDKKEVPKNSVACGRSLELRSSVRIRVSNFPQDTIASNMEVFVVNKLTSNQLAADLTALKHIQTCPPSEVDCNITEFSIQLPAFPSVGTQDIVIYRSGAVEGQLLSSIEVVEGCNWHEYCGKKAVPNFEEVLRAVSTECKEKNKYCVKPHKVMEPSISPIGPTRGSTAGGDEILISYANFPVLDVTDFVVEFRTANSVVLASAVSLSKDEGGSLEENSGSVIIVTPTVPSIASGVIQVYLSVACGSLQAEGSFFFEYVVPFVGTLTAMSRAPVAIYPNSIFSLLITLTNSPVFEPPFNTADIQVVFGSQDPVSADSIESSTAFGTEFRVTAFPETEWSVGPLAVLAYLPLLGRDRGASLNVTVRSIPSPTISELVPSTGRNNKQHLVQLVVSHLNVALSSQDVTAIMSGTTVEVMSFTLQDETCGAAECSVFALVLNLPTSTDVGVKTVDLSISGNSFQVDFMYISATAPHVEAIDPKSQMVVPDASSLADIFIYVSNFPSATCAETVSCASEAIGSTITFQIGAVSIIGEVNQLADASGMLLLVVRAPRAQIAGRATATIAKDTVQVTFDYAFVSAPAVVTPIDGSTAGGSILRISAYGLTTVNVSSGNELAVTIDGAAAQVSSVVHASTGWAALVLVPPASQAARVGGLVTHLPTGASTTFVFEYYSEPTATISPAQATLDGRTGRQTSVATIILKHFPELKLPGDISVTVGGRMATVHNIQNFVSASPNGATIPGSSLDITVPVGGEVGPSVVEVMFLSAADDREVKSAQTTLEYYVPDPELGVGRWCTECNNISVCLLAGKCLGGVDPLLNSVVLSSQGVLMVVMDNAPTQILESVGGDAVLRVIAQFGDVFAESVEIVSSDATTQQLIFRVVPPAFTEAASTSLAISMFFGLRSWQAELELSAVDDSVEIHCLGFGCLGPSSGGTTLTVAIYNLPLTEGDVASQLQAKFGSITADGLNVQTSNDTVTVLELTTPACAGCGYTSGEFTVDLQVSLLLNPNVGVSTPFTFWAPPDISRAISVTFDPSGASLIVNFDQKTDRGGTKGKTGDDCSQVVAPQSLLLLGNGSTCRWSSDKELVILLDGSPTILPGDAFTIQGVRSKNGISSATSTTAVVSLPSRPVRPKLVLTGPEKVDACGGLEVFALASSPRPLQYSWRGILVPGASNADSADVAWDEYLQLHSEPLLVLDTGTPQLAQLEKTYAIVVQVTDFMGFSSVEATRTVLKTATPSPSLTLSPAAVSTDRSQDIVVTAKLAFSACPVAAMSASYEYELLSGSQDIVPYLATSNPYLFIPKYVLTAGQVYSVRVTGYLPDDVTQTTNSILEIDVVSLPLLAIIAGGTSKTVSASSALSLDASGSLDLDFPVHDQPQPEALQYIWTCSFDVGYVSEPCRDSAGALIAVPPVATPAIAANTLVVSSSIPYLFTVTISGPDGGKLSSSTSMPVYAVSATGIPQVSVTTASGSLLSSGIQMVNSNDRLVIVGLCDVISGSRGWSFEPAVNLSDPQVSGQSGPVLLIPEMTDLLDPSTEYTVTHTCANGGQAGSSQLTLQVNQPPSGGTCTVCLKKGRRKCEAQPSSIHSLIAVFKISCSNWADTDGSGDLSYEFGVSAGGGNVQWGPSLQVNNMLTTFSTGIWTISARITDAQGGVAEVIVGELEIGSPSLLSLLSGLFSGLPGRGRGLLESPLGHQQRQLLEVSTTLTDEWASYENSFNLLMLAKDIDGVVYQVPSLVREVMLKANTSDAIQKASGVLEAFATGLLDSTVNSATHPITGITLSYAKRALAAAEQLVSNAQFQTLHTVGNTSSLMRFILDNIDEVQIPSSAVTSVAGIVSGGLESLNQFPSHDAKTFLSDMSVSTDEAVRRRAIALVVDETESYTTALSTHSVMKKVIAGFEDTSFTTHLPARLLNNTVAATVTVNLPSTLSNNLGFTNSEETTLYLQAHHHVHRAGGLLLRSPLFGVSLFGPNEAVAETSKLSANVEMDIPMLVQNGFTTSEMLRYRKQATCMWWDDETDSFLPDGCVTTVLPSNVVRCSCDHLTLFGVVQNVTGSCGDGIVESEYEECDDGNTVDGDGCDSNCVVESLYSCAGSPSICTVSNPPQFTNAIVWDETDLQGSLNEISVRLYFTSSWGLMERKQITLSGFTGSTTSSSTTVSLVVDGDSILNEGIWEQGPGMLTITLARDVTDDESIKFRFTLENPLNDNTASTVVIACIDCLNKPSNSHLTMGSLTKTTTVLAVSYLAPTCTDTTNFGTDCSQTCQGITRGAVCRCQPGTFGFDCSQTGVVVEEASVIVDNGAVTILTLTGGQGVSLPAGSLSGSEMLEVSMKVYDVTPEASPSQPLVSAGRVIVMGPRGVKFQNDVSLLLDYITPTDSLPLTTTGFVLNPATSLWENIGGTLLSDKLESAIDHFSTFSVFRYESVQAPSFTDVMIHDTTNLQGTQTEVTVLLSSNAILAEGQTVEVSGFLGSATVSSSSLTLVVEGDMISTTGVWDQTTGSLKVTIARDVLTTESIKFKFRIQNPSEDNLRSTVVVSCEGCNGYVFPAATMANITRTTNILQVNYRAPTCSDAVKYGDDCQLTCQGVVKGSLCHCPPGQFGDDCSQFATLLEEKSITYTGIADASIILSNGQGIRLPSGSIATDSGPIEVVMKLYDVLPQPSANQSIEPTGKAVVMSPRGQSFLKEVTLTLDSDPNLVPVGWQASGHWLNGAIRQWENIGGQGAGAFIEAQVDHFSTFAVMAVKLPFSTSTSTAPIQDTTSRTSTSTPSPTPVLPAPNFPISDYKVLEFKDDGPDISPGAIVAVILGGLVAILLGLSLFIHANREKHVDENVKARAETFGRNGESSSLRNAGQPSSEIQFVQPGSKVKTTTFPVAGYIEPEASTLQGYSPPVANSYLSAQITYAPAHGLGGIVTVKDQNGNSNGNSNNSSGIPSNGNDPSAPPSIPDSTYMYQNQGFPYAVYQSQVPTGNIVVPSQAFLPVPMGSHYPQYGNGFCGNGSVNGSLSGFPIGGNRFDGNGSFYGPVNGGLPVGGVGFGQGGFPVGGVGFGNEFGGGVGFRSESAPPFSFM